MAKVLYEKRNQIGYITLNRPEALNALDDELNDELWAVWRDFAEDDSLGVAILAGAGKAFCSGADALRPPPGAFCVAPASSPLRGQPVCASRM
jgi:enoyl-CoA hydratase/carnithine racemase